MIKMHHKGSSIRSTVHKILHESGTPFGRAFDLSVMIVILISIATVGFSLDSGMAHWVEVITVAEWVFTILFSIEYILRLWSASSPRTYACSFFGIIDLLAILPTFIGLFPGVESEYLFALRIIRLIRVVRIFKLCTDVGWLHSSICLTLFLFMGTFTWHFLRIPAPTTIIFQTGSERGLYHKLGIELKKVLELENQSLLIRLKNSEGSKDNVKALQNGKCHLALIQNDANCEEKIRSIAAIYPELLHLVCRRDSIIVSLNDLVGKKISIGANKSGTNQIVRELLNFVKVPLIESQTLALPSTDALSKLVSGEIDAAFFLTGLGSSIINEAMLNPDLVLKSIKVGKSDLSADAISRQFVDGFRVHYPHVSPSVIPQLAYEGLPSEPLPSLSVDAVLACSADLDSNTVKVITETLFEKRAILSAREPSFTYLDESSARSGLQFPIHKGAEYYYFRQNPSFLAENAESMGFVLTLLLLVWSCVNWARNLIDKSRKNRIDTYYQAIDEVIHQLKGSPNLEKINELENTLLEIRIRAADELVGEKLAGDESFLIYQNMLNGTQSMLLRIRERTVNSS